MIGSFTRVDKLGRRLVVILRGLPCSWGRCIFCPFALEQSVSLNKIIEGNKRIIEEAMNKAKHFKPNRVSIFNGSSFYELPYDTIIRLVPLTRVRVVDIEARSEQVTLDSLLTTLKHLEASRLVVRVGFEVWNEDIRNKYLKKGMPQSEVYRLAKLRREVKERKLPIDIVVYVLFGIKGISEEEVIRSVKEFNKLFDGVIAVKYQRYHPAHPEPILVSEHLAKFLEDNTLLVDWGESEEWVIAGKRGEKQLVVGNES